MLGRLPELTGVNVCVILISRFGQEVRACITRAETTVAEKTPTEVRRVASTWPHAKVSLWRRRWVRQSFAGGTGQAWPVEVAFPAYDDAALRVILTRLRPRGADEAKVRRRD